MGDGDGDARLAAALTRAARRLQENREEAIVSDDVEGLIRYTYSGLLTSRDEKIVGAWPSV